tara:strand:+ start:310 stop:570 length:261 start_codon:yes stop_codon:yes gene_type:complete
MSSEEIYNSVAYFMKEELGLPYNYDDLSIEQRVFIDAFVENFETETDQQIANLEMTISDLERDLTETELECRRLQKQLDNREGSIV